MSIFTPPPLTPSGSIKVSPTSTASQRIIAGGIIIAFCYWAASVLMTVLLAILISYFLDPFVEWLERFSVPRAVGSLVAVLLMLALLVGVGWMLWDRVDSFAKDWPRYRAPLKQAAAEFERRIQKLEKGVSEITPQDAGTGKAPAQPAPSPEGKNTIRNLLLSSLFSLYNILLAATFVPFLVFFMLAYRRDVWHGTMQLFPSSERTRVKETLEDIGRMLHGYVAGNVLVTAILISASWLFFLAIGLDYSLLIAILSGLLNMVPYLGALMAIIPPVIIGLTKFSIAGLMGIAGMIAFFHLIAGNVLIPAMVGRKVHLNPLAVTVALLFWGWMWGAIGFVLAIPITATMKVLCDRVDRWQPFGRWLSA